jgi:hypothetical protein
MKHRKLHILEALSLILILSFLVTSCAPPGTEVPEPQQPQPSEQEPQPAEQETSPITEEPQQPSDWLGEICPEIGPLPEDDAAYRPDFGEVTPEDKYFIRKGLYTNTKGQTFDINVKGIDNNAVLEYTDTLKVCMELLDIAEPAFETDVTDESEVTGEERSEDDIYQENLEALIIYANPSDANKEYFSKGYIWVYLIDPSIKNGVPHDYRKYCRDIADTTVMVSRAGGSVNATHYRRPPGGVNYSSSRNVNAGVSTRWIYNTRATYDLQVKGTSEGTTYYSVSGTIWNYGFYSLPPTGGGADCPKP